MNLSKTTKSFFNAHRQIKCSQCNEGALEKEIQVIIAKPLDDEYVVLLFWEHQPKNKTFMLRQSVGGESNEDIFLNNAPQISSITDLKTICSQLEKFGYYIDNVHLITECSNFDCHFIHRIDLDWSEDTHTIYLEGEHIDIGELSLRHNYTMRSTIIVVRDKKNQNYNFELLNLPIKNYKKLKQKLTQILLIG